MKYKKRILICISIYIFLGIGIFFVARAYTDIKDDRLKGEAYKNLNTFFEKQNKFISITYSNEKVSYEKTEIPVFKEKFSFFKDDKDEQRYNWEQFYGDIYKMYKLKPKYESDNKWSGYQFDVIEIVQGEYIRKYQIYPYLVGYKKQSESYIYNYTPSVQTAIDESFEFWSTNNKSHYKGYINNNISISDIKQAVENEYYMLFSYDECCEYNGKEYTDSIMTTGVKFVYIPEDSPFEAMSNGYYRVYNMYHQQYYYSIESRFWNPKKEERRRIIKWGYAILTVLLICYIIPLSVIENKKKQLQKESLKEKLLRIINPRNFMKPYNEIKVSMANDIYSRLQNIPPDDEVSLKGIRKEISNKLGVNFIDEDILKDLQKKCNPLNFMNPYNDEKIKISNQLYAKLQSKILTIDELEDIQDEYDVKLKS